MQRLKATILVVTGNAVIHETDDRSFLQYLTLLIQKSLWWQVYDICIETYALFDSPYHRITSKRFAEEIARVLEAAKVPWRFVDGKIERAFNPQLTQVIQEASILLQNPKFKGPSEQFRKAQQHLSRRPNSDLENCIKDGVGALEGLSRIIIGKPKATFSEIIKTPKFTIAVPRHILAAMNSVYVLRGDTPGIGHGQIGDSVITIDDAEWVLGECANHMIYLGKKFP